MLPLTILHAVIVSTLPTCEQVKNLYTTAECCTSAQAVAFDVLATQDTVDSLSNRFAVLEGAVATLLSSRNNDTSVSSVDDDVSTRLANVEASVTSLLTQNNTSPIESNNLLSGIEQNLFDLTDRIMLDDVRDMLGSNTYYINARYDTSSVVYNMKFQYTTFYQIFTDDSGRVKSHYNLKDYLWREIWWPSSDQNYSEPFVGSYGYEMTRLHLCI